MATSSSETSNNSTVPIATVPSLSNLPFTISVKLNSSNYPVWKAQALPYFRGQRVFGYLDGTILTPPQEIDAPHPSTGAIIKILNPQYNLWLRQDSLIFATINASLTEDVLTQVMSYPTSREPLKADDIITYVLAGLCQEYDSLASTITSRSDPVTLEELYSLLLICESRINHNNQSLQAAASVNLATKQPQRQCQSPFRTAANFQPSNCGRGGYRGRGRGGRFNSRDQGPSNSVICQVCFKPGQYC
ncbi:hypothetical protein F0562_000422 [Nyssa sinensis]|uniref:Retrotransposon Copia-like N-terminal domain-containing protein n=1 Tax=Nyssa sinensis TaxID=561372 RepID=A0A5J5C0E8_9ASTE|nr:hypothetical protein F0562_000422 [Nyssa sinensis]